MSKIENSPVLAAVPQGCIIILGNTVETDSLAAALEPLENICVTGAAVLRTLINIQCHLPAVFVIDFRNWKRGWRTVRMLRRSPICARLPILAINEEFSQEEAELLLALNIHQVQTPYNPASLQKGIVQLLASQVANQNAGEGRGTAFATAESNSSGSAGFVTCA